MRTRDFLLPILAASALIAPRGGFGAERPKRVLILDSIRRDVVPLSNQILAFRAELRSRWPDSINLIEVSLEADRFPEPESDRKLVAFLEGRLGRDPIDLVVPFGTPAMLFVTQHRQRLFPGAPLLIVGVEERRLTPKVRDPATIVVGLRIDITGVVEDILGVVPGTQEIALIFGASPLERFWLNECRREFVRFKGRVRFRWLDSLSFKAMKQEVAKLPRDVAVLYVLLLRDVSGVSFEQNQALLDLSGVSTAPMFACFESQLGSGIVGGRLFPDRSLGERAAETAARILGGEPTAGIDPVLLGPMAPSFDGRELERWGISEGLLPPHSTVLFRPPSFWRLYRWYVLGLVGLFSVQSALIVGLHLQRRRRNRAERQLVQSERRLQLITDSLPVLIAYVDRDQRYVFNNCAFKAWFDIDPEDARGRAMCEVLGDELYRSIRPYVERVLCGTQVSYTTELPVIQGKRRAAEVIYVPDRDDRGDIWGFYLLAVDVTDRMRAEREVRQLKDDLALSGRIATMGELAAALAHELNQPLAAILSNAEAAIRFLKAPTPDLEEVRDILRDIAADDTRAGEVIRRIRSLVKRDAAEFCPLSLNAVLEEVVVLLRSDPRIHGVVISLELDPDLPDVKGDRIQLQQVLLNLLLNAFEAMSEDSSEERAVVIRSRHVDTEVLVTVSDFGPGIPSEDLDRVFEPFRSTKNNGLGMGLSISRSIVASHGGRLWARNNPERGATFSFSLPVPTFSVLAGAYS